MSLSPPPSAADPGLVMTHPTEADIPWRMAEHWPELVVALTDQAIESVDLLMRGLELMVQRGKLSKAEFQVLATPAQRLKHCGVHAQQIIRFQSGQVRLSHEKIDLAYVVESVLQERRDQLALQGITVRRKFIPTELLIDPTLGYSLAQAMLDWSVSLGHHLDLRLDATLDEPARGRLWMRVHSTEPVAESAVFLDRIEWLLLRQIAATDGGIELLREVTPDGVELTAWFKRVMPSLPNASQQSADGMVSTVFKTVSRAYVLVCSAAPTVRLKALGIVKQLGVQADGVASGTQAASALRNREVHLLILDEAHPPADIAQLRFDLAALYPDLAVLQLVQAQVANQKTQVSLDGLDAALGSAVMFTLSNVL